MENKILLENSDSEEQKNTKQISEKSKKENTVNPNFFLGRTEAELKNVKFPDWDILPSNQFINPRLKNL